MKSVVRTLAVIVVLGLARCALAAEETLHRDAALRFYEASKVEEPGAVGDLVADMIIRLQPGLGAHRDILAEFARELVVSDRYREAQVKVYMEMFSADELDSLAQMFTTRVFSKYRRLRIPLVKRTTEATIGLLRESLPEFEKRIRERSGARTRTAN